MIPTRSHESRSLALTPGGGFCGRSFEQVGGGRSFGCRGDENSSLRPKAAEMEVAAKSVENR